MSGLSAAPGVVHADSVYINPEVRTQFAGGDKAYMAYLSKSIRYPQQALQRHVSGRVYVNFILSAQGRGRMHRSSADSVTASTTKPCA